MVAVFSALPRLVLPEIGQLTVWEDISSGGASVNSSPGFPVCAGVVLFYISLQPLPLV